MSNKANIERQAIDKYVITSNQVVSYLQSQLGFPIGADFTRWTGVTGNHSYVRMRVGIANKDIVAQTSEPKTYAERVLQQNAAGTMFKDRVINTLRPFMYPKDMSRILNDQEKVNNMLQYGVYGDRINEIMKFSQLAYVQDQQMWRVYLRPEKILEDMLSDPATGRINGSFSIVGVFGVESDTIRWEIEILGSDISNTELGDISIDRLFAIM